MDDATLVRQAVDGDREAFASIYDRYAPRIYDFLRSLLRDPEEAADAVQDTFLTAGARLHQLRDPEKLRPWLYAIARHRGLRAIEKRSRHRSLDDVDVTSTDPDPSDVAADGSGRGELAALVAAAAEGLGPRDQILLQLHMGQGLDGQELGDAIGVSASHAYVLASRLRDQVERSLGALLVARQVREDCPELDTVLAGWDGRFTPLWRKRVARHADGCPVCSDRRSKLLSPAGLLGAAPAFALPASLRDKVMGDLELCTHTGRPWKGDGGFPPPLAGTRRRWPAAVAAVAAVVLLAAGWAVGGQLAGDRDDDPPAQVAAVGTTAGPTTTTTTPTPTTGVSGGTTTVPDGPTLPPGVAPPVVDPDPGPGSIPEPDPDPDPDPDPEPGSATTTTRPPPTTTTTVRPPDTSPPSLSNPVADPGTIRAVTPCVIGSPRVATVTVQASDRSGIDSVVLHVGGQAPATLGMTATGGGGYEAVVGPLPGTPGVSTTTVALTVTATDGAGNVATSRGSLALRCVSPAGGP